MPIRILSGHQVFGGYSRFVTSVPFASVLVPCRAALHPRSSVYGPHIQTVGRLCPRHCGVVRLCHTHAAHIPARRCRVLSASSCPVRNRPRCRSIPLWSALVRSCSLRLHFNDTPHHLNQPREQLANQTYVDGLLSHQNSNQATDSGTRMAHVVKKAC